MAASCNHNGKVCLISRSVLSRLEEQIEDIKCEDLPPHRHINRGRADQLNELQCVRMRRDNDGKEVFNQERDAVYVGKRKRFMVFERARYWATRLSGGTPVKQLVVGAAPW